MSHAFPEVWRRGVYEAIARRRDLRSFLPDPIPREVLARVLSAAHQAPSVGFSRPWSFLVVEDREVRGRIRAHVEAERLRAAEAFARERREEYPSFELEGILDAPLNLCVTCDRERFGPAVIGRNTIPETAVHGACAAVQNLRLAARAEGLGVGWVSILEPGVLREILGIPHRIVPVAYLCVGYVEGFPERPMLETAGWLPPLPLRDLVYQDRWGEAPGPELVAALDAAAAAPAPPARSGPERRGLLLVYTGHGKGKTTAALGIVFRALGRGLRVAVVQFIKGKWKTGERLFAETMPGLAFHVMGRGFTWESEDLAQDRRAAAEAWNRAKAFIAAGEHEVVVLDEITYAMNHGFIEPADVLATLRDRPAHVHVVTTGRDAPGDLCAQADLVTEMKAVKHPFQQGLRAQPGIDF